MFVVLICILIKMNNLDKTSAFQSIHCLVVPYLQNFPIYDHLELSFQKTWFIENCIRWIGFLGPFIKNSIQYENQVEKENKAFSQFVCSSHTRSHGQIRSMVLEKDSFYHWNWRNYENGWLWSFLCSNFCSSETTTK